jgi:GxxExxY protein
MQEPTSQTDISEFIIGAAIEVHRHLGPGLLESTYQHCLSHELHLRGIEHHTEVSMPVEYKGTFLECGYRLDLLFPNSCIVELKSVHKLDPIHEAQLLTYMKLAKIRYGLLINFNVNLLKEGIKRMIL